MEKTQLTKREFLKLSALGGLGLFFMDFYHLFPKNDSDVIFLSKKDKRYDEFRVGYNLRIDQYPAYIALCLTEKGVQKAVNFAREEKLKITVKSGGHSFEGFSSNNQQLMINLSLMNKINWLDKAHVKLEPACLLQDIYANFLPKKRILPAGSCGTVAIAGLTLGGGYGFFGKKFGLTCDSLYRVRMVNAKGEIVDSDHDSSLLWACRGGGNGNFGVVTALYFNTYKAPDFFHAHRLKFRNLTAENYQKIMQLWFSISDKLPEEAFSAAVLNGKTLTILVTHILASDNGFSKQLQRLISLASEYKAMPNRNLAAALKNYYGRKDPLIFKNASAGLYTDYDEVKEVLKSVFEKVVSQPGTIYQINTLGGKINSVGNTETAYPHRNKKYLAELQAYWTDRKRDKNIIDNFNSIQQIIEKNGVQAHYRNYPDLDFSNANKKYFQENLARLEQLKNKYDPNQLFDYPQVIGK